MKNIVVDFESYYSKKEEVSAGDTGVPNYVKNSYAYMVAIGSDPEHVVSLTSDGDDSVTIPTAVRAIVEAPDTQVWAANSNFDQRWYEHITGQRVRPWKCVLDLGAYHQLPRSLSSLSQVVLGTKVDKTLRDQMDGVHWSTLGGAQKESLRRYCEGDVKATFEILNKLAPMDSVEDRVSALTRLQNRRGVHINTGLLFKNRTDLEEAKFNFGKLLPWVEHGEAPLSPQQLEEYCSNHGIKVPASLAKDDDECAALMGSDPRLNALVSAMRGFRKCNTLIRKIDSILARLGSDDVMPLEMLYCGAPHTRRWSSRGVNVQNLDRLPFVLAGDLGGEAILDLLYEGSDIPSATKFVYPRQWLVPPPGCRFLMLDFAQIEPRVLHWLVGNEAMLGWVRRGFSVYEAFARATGKWTSEAPLKKAAPEMYRRVKAEVLGLGYGMGADRYVEYAATNGVTVTREEAVTIVNDFRTRNPGITGLWNMLDQLPKKAVLEQDKTICIDLPNGSTLKHWFVQSRRNSNGRPAFCSYTTKGDFGKNSKQDNLWGGVLTENVVQRTARDIMAESVLRLEESGFPVVFSSHDEAILAVPDDDKQAEAIKAEAERVMAQAPDWCGDLPLEVEGDFHSHYIKI